MTNAYVTSVAVAIATIAAGVSRPQLTNGLQPLDVARILAARYPEEVSIRVTAMTVAAMARGVRRGWLDRGVVPAIDRGWRAVLTRVSADGTLRDVCASTGAGPTREYYLSRPAINGADDRGGAMALLAALEVHELRANSRR